MGRWARFKLWVKDKAYTLIWNVVRSRFYKTVRKVVKKALLPVGLSAVGAGVGTLAAYAITAPLWLGAVLGFLVAGGCFVIYKACEETNSRRRSMSARLSFSNAVPTSTASGRRRWVLHSASR